MRNRLFLALALAVVIGVSAIPARAAGFDFYFDENGHGFYDLRDGTGQHASAGFAQFNPTYSVNALTYLLPAQISAGTVTVKDLGGAISDAFNFYNQDSSGYLAFFSDGGGGDLADTLSGGFVPDSGFYITEDADGKFSYFSGGTPTANNSYYGLSDGDTAVPEPSSLLDLGVAGIGLAFAALRRRP